MEGAKSTMDGLMSTPYMQVIVMVIGRSKSKPLRKAERLGGSLEAAKC